MNHAPRLSERLWMGLSLFLFVVLVFTGSQFPLVAAKDSGQGSLFKELKVFTDVLSLVQRDYVKEVENKKLVEGAIKGMLAELDPHSGYMDPEFYQDLRVETKGEFGGLGIEITIKEGLLVVVSPMEGSPAEKAGIRSGDAIIKIEGRYTKEFSLIDAVKKLRGPKGSSVSISIARKGMQDLIDVTIVRDNIMVKSVRSRYLGDGFGYVRINQFMEHTGDDLRAALKKLHAASPDKAIRGLIIDLRNNPGGLLNQAIAVADTFLEEGVIVYTDGRVESQKQKFFAHERNTEESYPIIVIVNGGSASASEIVSGALKDHGRALVLGSQTFGKGSVQTILPLENGGALRLTTALYYTKSGRTIQGEGVVPDIIMENIDVIETAAEEPAANEKPRTIETIREKDLPGALIDGRPNGGKKGKEGDDSVSKGGSKSSLTLINPEKEDITLWLTRDKQVQRALELLKTFNIFKGQPADPIAKEPIL